MPGRQSVGCFFGLPGSRRRTFTYVPHIPWRSSWCHSRRRDCRAVDPCQRRRVGACSRRQRHRKSWPPVPTLVEDINVSTAPSNPAGLTAAGNAIFFVADDGIHGSDLWITDGTGGGTRMVWDFQPGASWSMPMHLTAIGSVVFFAGYDAASRRRALDKRRHERRYSRGQRHQSRPGGLVRREGLSPSVIHCFSTPAMTSMAMSCGPAMARQPAHAWSRTSGQARKARTAETLPRVLQAICCILSPTTVFTETSYG